MGQPRDPLNGRLVAYDELLGLKCTSTNFASGSSGARWERRPVQRCDAAMLISGFNPQNLWWHTLTRERRRRSWPALQTWCDLKALVSSAYFRPGFEMDELHDISWTAGPKILMPSCFATGMQRNSRKFALCLRRSLGWFRVQKGGVTGWVSLGEGVFLHPWGTMPVANHQVARFFNMVSLLADFLGVHSNKERDLQAFQRCLIPTRTFKVLSQAYLRNGLCMILWYWSHGFGLFIF